MTSLFSVIDTLASLTVTACVLFLTVGGPGAVEGSLHIPQCSAQGWLEVRENETSGTVIQCEGFGANQTVVWQLIENYTVQASSTCAPMSTLGACDTSSVDITVLRTTNTTTTLIIKNNHRQHIGNGSVKCLVQGDSVESDDTCKTNVINPAVLSDCEVNMTTLAGTCNFHNAYSSNGIYTCTWTLTPLDTQEDSDVIIPGMIHKTPHTLSSKQYYNGTCSFTKSKLQGTKAGNYSYTVSFFPGSQYSGKETVTVTDSALITLDADGKRDLGISNAKDEDIVSDQEKDKGTPVWVWILVVGVVVGAILIIVGVVIWRRKKRTKPETDKDTVESRGPSRASDNRDGGGGVSLVPDAYSVLEAGAPGRTDGVTYANDNRDGAGGVSPVPDTYDGGYCSVSDAGSMSLSSSPNNMESATGGNEYAQVNKSGALNTTAPPQNDMPAGLAGKKSTPASGCESSTEHYAHLDIGKGGAGSVTPLSKSPRPSDNSSSSIYNHLDHGMPGRADAHPTDSPQAEEGGDVYAQVDKSSKEKKPPAPEREEHPYKHPPKPESVKPVVV